MYQLTLSVALAYVLFAGACGAQPALNFPSTSRPALLVYHEPGGSHTGSNAAALSALRELGDAHGFRVTAASDPSAFEAASLEAFRAVVLLNASGAALSTARREALQRFVETGGGLAALHAAAQPVPDWPWIAEALGTSAQDACDLRSVEVLVSDRVHPATRHLPARWAVEDAVYDYAANPRGLVHVLAHIDDRAWEGGAMGHDHPVIWARPMGSGRVWYSGLGHEAGLFRDPMFRRHLLGGVRWAAGLEAGDANATRAGSFRKVVLDADVTYPMEVDIAEDGRVFYIERDGAVKVWLPEQRRTEMAGFLPVTTLIEDGLLGLALDPGFSENGWMYLYYSPADLGPQRLSRFTVVGHAIDMASERIMLEIPVQREVCCHSGGSLEFGPDGTLFLSTGDNSGAGRRVALDPQTRQRYSDQRRTSGSTNDLRGKVLRIRPLPDGTYEIPEGNLFEADDLHRGEIYTMGHRNPFRIAVDPGTGWLYWGDVGRGASRHPDDSPGYEEFNQARQPGNLGWPFASGPNSPFLDIDPETGEPIGHFQLNPLYNDSPFNTGARTLPPPQPALIWYDYTPGEAFPEMGAGGMSAMAGPVYRYDPDAVGPYGFPAYYHGTVFLYEWMRNWVKDVRLDETGDLLAINPFMDDVPLIRPVDLAFARDGTLYVLEWGTSFWGSNRDAQLVRIEYVGQHPAPSPPPPPLETAPITFREPRDGAIVDLSEPLWYDVTPARNDLEVRAYLGHDTHLHLQHARSAARDTVRFEGDPSHGPYIVDHFAVLEARYRDLDAVQTPRRIRLWPQRIEAEHAPAMDDALLTITGNRQRPSFFDSTQVFVTMKAGGRLSLSPIALENTSALTLRVQPKAHGGIRLRLNDTPGSILGEAELAPAEGWQLVTIPIQPPTGTHTLHVEAMGDDGVTVMDVDWLDFALVR